MKDRRPGKDFAREDKKPCSDGPGRVPAAVFGQKLSDRITLGLRAFEKISAVEGVRLSGEMRRDLRSLGARRLDEEQRSRFIIEKYGKE